MSKRYSNAEIDGSEINVKLHGRDLIVSPEAWKSFQEYRSYGDWASETEKTDYTYSRLSRFRSKEEGDQTALPVRPNLSRSPIHGKLRAAHDDFYLLKHRQQEKYVGSNNYSFNNHSYSSHYKEVREEVDNFVNSARCDSSTATGNWLSRLSSVFRSAFTSVVSLFTWCYSALFSAFASTGSAVSHCAASICSFTTSIFTVTTVYEYFSSSSTSRTREQIYLISDESRSPINDIKFFLAKYKWLVLLLPLILLTGWWLVRSDDASPNLEYFSQRISSGLTRCLSSLQGFSGSAATAASLTMESALSTIYIYYTSFKNSTSAIATESVMEKCADNSEEVRILLSKISALEERLNGETTLDLLMGKLADLEERLKRQEDGRNQEFAELHSLHDNLEEYKIAMNAAMRRCHRQTVAAKQFHWSLFKQSQNEIASRKSSPCTEPCDVADLNEVRRVVAEAIALYDADKTGRADYALETAGGRVVSIRCTKAYSLRTVSWFGLPFLSASSSASSPSDAIRPGTAPGECWAFQGSVGFLALELSHTILVSGFSLEHIPRVLSPLGLIDSAPKHFSMWGLNSPEDVYDQYLFGEYMYDDASGETIQYFPVAHPTQRPFKFVEMKIISNHGHPDYTCIYRIRVHGTVT